MMTSPSEQLLRGALGLATRGIPVIPLRPRSKIPVHRNWPDLGLLDLDAIEQQWRLNPESNVGVLCGAEAFAGEGLTVLDVDVPDGPRTLEALQEQHGALPSTDTVETPSGGVHHYARGHTASWNPGAGVEVRSVGRQCAAPPSIHPSGGRYSWFQRTRPLAQLPAWLVKPDDVVATVVTTRAGPSSGLRDPVLDVPPPVYFKALCGLVPDRYGFVCCPIHGENQPSLKVYDTVAGGWFCYGESCRRGGDVVTLVTYLAGMTPPLRGVEFWACLDYLRGVL